MARFAVLQRYASTDFGPWEPGTQVELQDAEADWVNRDSPGTLRPIPAGMKLKPGQIPDLSEEKAEAEEAPAEASAASTADEGAPVADKPRGRSRGASRARGS